MILTGRAVDTSANFDKNPESLKINITGSPPNTKIGNLFFKKRKETIGEGQYLVRTVRHLGDTHGDLWMSETLAFVPGQEKMGSTGG